MKDDTETPTPKTRRFHDHHNISSGRNETICTTCGVELLSGAEAEIADLKYELTAAQSELARLKGAVMTDEQGEWVDHRFALQLQSQLASALHSIDMVEKERDRIRAEVSRIRARQRTSRSHVKTRK